MYEAGKKSGPSMKQMVDMIYGFVGTDDVYSGKKRGVCNLIGNAPTMMSHMEPGGVFKLNQILPILFSHLNFFFGYRNKDLDYRIESCGARAFTRCQKIVMQRLRVLSFCHRPVVAHLDGGIRGGGKEGQSKFAKTGGCFFQIFSVGNKIPVFWLKTSS